MDTLGIDLGGTYARAAVVDEKGKILGQAKEALTDRSPQAVIAAIVDAAGKARAAAPGSDVSRCGVGVAGQLRGNSGHVLVAPNLGWRDVPFGELLAKALGHHARVINDLSAAAWGEHVAGAGVGARDLLVVSVGTGVGSAIILNAQLVNGARGVAGELGHIKVVPDGRKCGCGELGCLEAYVGGHNLILLMKDALAAGKAPKLKARLASQATQAGQGAAEPSPADLEWAAGQGDTDAQEIYERALGFLTLAVANQVTMLNPSHLLFGGGVLAHAPRLRQRLEEGVMKYALAASREGLTIRTVALGDDSGLIGAALLARLEPA